ncbi:LytR C-terminal domain-containing protein [Candidatus Gottesmanbacteria bacterium]|nr:LytR C-terminal domain-containing protein [Candidatus Gottesmanbacteria bacterium]
MTNRQKRPKVIFWRFFLILIPILGIMLLKLLFFRGLWQNLGRTTIVFNTIPILIVSLNHENNSAQILSLPTTAEIDVVEGYGKYRAGKIYSLDKLEKKEGKLFINSFSRGLGVPIDGFVSYADNTIISDENQLTKEDIARYKQKLFSPDFFLHLFWQKGSLVATNLTIVDYIRSFIFLSGVRPNKIDFINLFREGAFANITLPDQTKSLATDYQKIDGITRETFNEQPVVFENLKVEVLNSTDYEGLADEVARIISHLGAAVLSTGNDSEKVEGCKIYIAKTLAKTYTVKRLQGFFHCQLSLEKRAATRTDLSLILGEKIKKEFRTH